MKLKTAVVIGIVFVVVVILAAALFYGHTNQAGYTTGASVERDQSHNGDGWIFWPADGGQHDSQYGSDHVDSGPTTSFEDFYDSDKSEADASSETSFEDFYSDSGSHDSGSDTSFGDFYSDSGSDSWSDSDDWSDSSDWSDSGDWGDSGDFGGDSGGDW